MNAQTVRIRVSEESDGSFSAEELEGAGRSARRSTREAAVAAVQAAVLRDLAERLADGRDPGALRGITFEVRTRRVIPVRPESRPGLCRVMLVEDDVAIRAMMRRALEAASFRVLDVCSAEEAVALLEQTPSRVDLIVSDVMLPGESGIELAHRLEVQFPGMRILLVSGYAPHDPAGGAPFDPGTAFLPKPFTGEQLLAKVREMVRVGGPISPASTPGVPSVPPEVRPRRRLRSSAPQQPDIARVLLAAPNPAEARFIGNYLESITDHRVRVETAATSSGVRSLTARRTYDLMLVDHALMAQDPATFGELAAQVPVVTLQPTGEATGEGSDRVVRRESAMLANLASAVTRLIGLPEPSDEARAARRHAFVDVVCHDLRNPASTIAGYAELMLDRARDSLSRDQMSSLARIRRNAYFMLDLIESILDSERLDAGVLRPAPQTVDLGELVRETVDDFRPAAEGKSIGLVLHLPASPVRTAVDAKLLARAVSNLVSNAIKFSPADSSIEVGIVSAGRRIEISVRDQGPGIPQAEQERLFTKFGRTSVVATRGEHQTGLGLFIVKRIVELHGGRIVVDSAPGRGSEFRIELATA